MNDRLAVIERADYERVATEREQYREAWLARGRRINGTGEFADEGPLVPASQLRGAVARLDAIRGYLPMMDSGNDAAAIRALLDVDLASLPVGGQW